MRKLISIIKYPLAVYLVAGLVVWNWDFTSWILAMRITVGILIVISTLIGIDKNDKK